MLPVALFLGAKKKRHGNKISPKTGRRLGKLCYIHSTERIPPSKSFIL